MTINITELRRLAQAATPGPDGVSLSWIKLLQDFQQGANPAAINELLDRLEAAEKSDAESIAMYRKARDERDELRAAVRHEADCMEAAMAEIKSLRAKIEAMEKQKPVGQFIQHPSNGLWEQDGYGDNPDARPLYALPGAKGESE